LWDALSCVARSERLAVGGAARAAEARAAEAEEVERAEYEGLRQLDARSAALHPSALYRQQMHKVLKGAPNFVEGAPNFVEGAPSFVKVLKGAPNFVDAVAGSSMDGVAGGGRADEAQQRHRRSSLPVYRGADATPAITPAGPSYSSVARPSEGKPTARTAAFAPSPSLVPASSRRESGGAGGIRLLPPNSLRRPSPLDTHPPHVATPAPPPPVPAATAMAVSEDAPVPEVTVSLSLSAHDDDEVARPRMRHDAIERRAATTRAAHEATQQAAQKASMLAQEAAMQMASMLREQDPTLPPPALPPPAVRRLPPSARDPIESPGLASSRGQIWAYVPSPEAEVCEVLNEASELGPPEAEKASLSLSSLLLSSSVGAETALGAETAHEAAMAAASYSTVFSSANYASSLSTAVLTAELAFTTYAAAHPPSPPHVSYRI